MSVKIVYIVDHGTNWLMTESVMSIHLILRSICLLFSLVLGIPLKALLRDERMFVHLVLSVPLKAASDFGLTDLASLLKCFHMLVDFASSRVSKVQPMEEWILSSRRLDQLAL